MSNVPATIEQKPRLVAGHAPAPIVPTSIEQVWRFAEVVARSGMAPRGMERPEQITVAIMHGLEIGLTPLMALQRIAVVNGRPTIWGDAAMALVRASGLCEFVRESIKGDGENMVAICTVKRKDDAEAATREFSVGDAKRAALWGKSGPWTQYPKRMLQMRARAFALRDTFADVLGGLYLREELEDRPMRDVTPMDEPPIPPSPPTQPSEPDTSPEDQGNTVIWGEDGEREATPEEAVDSARITKLDAVLAKAAKKGTRALEAAWDTMPADARTYLEAALERRHVPTAEEADHSQDQPPNLLAAG